MAKTVKTFNFTSRRSPFYPWDEWFDGRIWQLTKGEDFSVSLHSFRTCAYLAASKRGGRVRSSTSGDVVTLQFLKEAKR